MRGRLREETLERFVNFGGRVVALAEELEKQGRSHRVVEQITGSGTAPGANVFEAHEALSRRDFIKCLGIARKELSETRFWITLIERRGWIAPPRLQPLLDESDQLLAILSTIIARTRRRDADAAS